MDAIPRRIAVLRRPVQTSAPPAFALGEHLA